jgi:L-lactate dehydrogenase complex protein LldF
VDASLPYASTLCGACYEVCPVAIDIPEVLVHLRERVVNDEPGHVLERSVFWTVSWVFRHPWLLETGQILASVLGRVPVRWLPGPGAAWASTRDLPRPPKMPFRTWRRRKGTWR